MSERGYRFTHPVDPEKPLDPADPPPCVWRIVCPLEQEHLRYGWQVSVDVQLCDEREKRELERHKQQHAA